MNTTIASWRERGFGQLGAILDASELEGLRGRADDLMLGRVSYPGLFYQHDSASGLYEDLEFGKGWQGPSLNYRKIEKLELDPLFRNLIEHKSLTAIAGALIQGPIAIYRAVLFNKAAQGGTPLPWHQDCGKFWGLDRDPFVEVWIALDDAPLEAGCLEFIPGSHHDGLATPLGGMIPENLVEARLKDACVERVPARAGEGLLIHNAVWHRSGINTTRHPRRGVSICYMSAATRCVRKKRAPRVFFQLQSTAKQ